MIAAATAPPERRDDVRLLAIDRARGTLTDRAASDLPALLAPGDLVVVNDAATVPASLAASAPGHGDASIEVRLAGPTDDERRWRAILFGAGDWRTATEERPPPPALAAGATLAFAGGLGATIAAVDDAAPRLVELVFDRGGAALWQALYAAGRPVQYSYVARPLALWSVQTLYGGRPWSVEMPSAGRPLSWALLAALRARGVALARVTHAAGLSSTGDPALDARLPLPERSEVPATTAAAIERAKARGGRVIAIGTSVVRALEAAARRATAGALVAAGVHDATLRIAPDTRLRVVDAILSGVHGPDESHGALLAALAGEALIAAAWDRAGALGYRAHELGDLMLVA